MAIDGSVMTGVLALKVIGRGGSRAVSEPVSRGRTVQAGPGYSHTPGREGLITSPVPSGIAVRDARRVGPVGTQDPPRGATSGFT